MTVVLSMGSAAVTWEKRAARASSAVAAGERVVSYDDCEQEAPTAQAPVSPIAQHVGTTGPRRRWAYDTASLAAGFDVTEETVRRWIRSGKLDPARPRSLFDFIKAWRTRAKRSR